MSNNPLKKFHLKNKRLFRKLIRSINFRMTFFMIFALTISNVLAGGVMTILYFTQFGRSLRLNPLKLTIIVLAFSYVSSAIFSIILNRNFLHPLRKLTDATKQVAEGNYDVKLTNVTNAFTRQSELGTLVDGFEYMTNELSSTEIFRNDFIHNFSHEFKTPIISIRGFARQIYNGNLTPEQQSEFAKIIVDESERLATMSSNVLLLSKVESLETVTDKTTFSLDEQLRSVMLIFEEQWSTKNITIDMELDEIEFTQNEDLLYHVWLNIIGNAVKFTQDNGSITVKCHRGTDYVYVIVKDNGIGMDENVCKHIFEKFYQGDSSHATAGNGLGLSLVKRIIDLMDGRISVVSNPGNGTEITVSFKSIELSS